MAGGYRRNLLNSLTGPKGAHLLGSQSATGVPNLGLFSQVLHLGANPPLVGVLFRPTTVPRHSLENLRTMGAFTLNPVPLAHLEAAHQTSANYPEGTSEFEATGLTPGYPVPDFPAPAVAEFAVNVGLVPVEEHPIAANGTILVVGKVVWLHLPNAASDAEGNLAPAATALGLNMYGRFEHVQQLPYARPPRN